MIDPNGRKEVIATAHDLNKKKGVTIILITHYMEEVVDADYVYVMEKGKIVMDGTPRDIFFACGRTERTSSGCTRRQRLWQMNCAARAYRFHRESLTRKELVDAIMSVANA